VPGYVTGTSAYIRRRAFFVLNLFTVQNSVTSYH
jgi:hypothetical protein